MNISNEFHELDVRYGIYIGGFGDFDKIDFGKLNYFRGCLDSLYFNGINVFESITKTGQTFDTIDCKDDLLFATSYDEITFLNSDAFMVLHGFNRSTEKNGVISFDVKTSSFSAVLFYNSGSFPNQTNFIMIEIINGKIALSINYINNNMIMFQSDIIINDGFWHHVDIQFRFNYVHISVDEKIKNLTLNFYNEKNQLFDLNEMFYVGNIQTNNHDDEFRHNFKSNMMQKPRESFKGCLKKIKIQLQYVEIVKSKGIQVGSCQWEFPCLIHNRSVLCSEELKCFQQGFNGFKCLCIKNICGKSNSSDLLDDKLNLNILTKNIQPLKILSGSSGSLTDNLIDTLFDYSRYGIANDEVLFHVIRPPQHGSLNNLTDNTFTLNDLIEKTIRYTNDGLGYDNDSIVLQIEIDSNSNKFYPIHIRKNDNFIFDILIHPINDAPDQSMKNSDKKILKVPRNKKKTISNEILNVNDDSDSNEIIYEILKISNGEESFIENIHQSGKSIKRFSQKEINSNLIRFVHKSKSIQQNKSKQSQIFNNFTEVIFLISNNKGESIESKLIIELVDLKIEIINNTGIQLPYNSFGLIYSTNLSAQLNFDSDQVNSVRFDIIKPSQFGTIQKLRGNGNWMNVTFFTMKHINKKKVRYVHLRGKPIYDHIQLQVSFNDTKETNFISFKIAFISLKLKLFSTRKLLIDHEAKKIQISSDQLRYDTEPILTPPNNIVYTILSLPSFGNLYLIDQTNNKQIQLNISSLLTQKIINENQLHYMIKNETSSLNSDDSFDFEVTTLEVKTDVQVSSFQ